MLFPTLPAEIANPLAGGTYFIVTLVVLLGLRYLLLRRLRGWSVSTNTRVDDVIVAAVHTPSLFWSVAVALEVAVRTSPLDEELRALISQAISILVMLSMTLVGASIAGGVATEFLRRQSPDGTVPGLGQVVVRNVVVILGLLVVLNALGVEIAPLLTALGVGGLAVALALQDSLTNFFAGIHILLERPYNIGNFIKLEDGQEGHVLDIGWRTTRIRTIQDDVIVIPNSKMAGSTILNYHMPVPSSRLVLRVGVAYDSDVERVRDVLVGVVNTARSDLGYVLADPPPEALLLGFGDFSLNFELRYNIADIAQQLQASDEIHRRIIRRFREEEIEIPFPVRTVVMKRE